MKRYGNAQEVARWEITLLNEPSFPRRSGDGTRPHARVRASKLAATQVAHVSAYWGSAPPSCLLSNIAAGVHAPHRYLPAALPP